MSNKDFTRCGGEYSFRLEGSYVLMSFWMIVPMDISLLAGGSLERPVSMGELVIGGIFWGSFSVLDQFVGGPSDPNPVKPCHSGGTQPLGWSQKSLCSKR